MNSVILRHNILVKLQVPDRTVNVLKKEVFVLQKGRVPHVFRSPAEGVLHTVTHPPSGPEVLHEQTGGLGRGPTPSFPGTHSSEPRS